MFEMIKKSFQDSLDLVRATCLDQAMIEKTCQMSELIAASFKNKRKVLVAGNGGSACDAMHFAEEFTGKFRDDRPALPVISINDPSHLTAVSNDFGFEYVFTRSIEAFGQPGDIFVGLSTSGNSDNIITAVQKSQSLGLKTIALLGRDGGQLKGMADLEFIIPGQTSDKVQEVHMMILHIVIEGVERILFPEIYPSLD